LVPISTTRLMLVVITDTGRVEQRIVELPGPTAGDDILELRGKVNSKLGGKPLTEAAGLVQSLVDEVAPLLRPAMASLASVLLEPLVERRDPRSARAGSATPARRRGGFEGAPRRVPEPAA